MNITTIGIIGNSLYYYLYEYSNRAF